MGTTSHPTIKTEMINEHKLLNTISTLPYTYTIFFIFHFFNLFYFSFPVLLYYNHHSLSPLQPPSISLHTTILGLRSLSDKILTAATSTISLQQRVTTGATSKSRHLVKVDGDGGDDDWRWWQMMVVVRKRCGADSGRMVVVGRTTVGDLEDSESSERWREKEKWTWVTATEDGDGGGGRTEVVRKRWLWTCSSVVRETKKRRE